MIQNDNDRWEYNGDGVSLAFQYDNVIFAAANIDVYVGGVLQALTVDYSVTVAPDYLQGNVTFVVAPPVGVKNVIIQRRVPNDQKTTFPIGSDFPSKAVEKAFDRLCVQVQQLATKVTRSLQLGPTVTGVASLLLATLEAGKFIRINGAGDGLELASIVTSDNVVSAGEGIEGIAARATQAMVNAGVNTTDFVTSKTLKDSTLSAAVTANTAAIAVNAAAIAAKPAALQGQARDLTGKNNVATPNSQFDMSAAEIILKDPNGAARSVALAAILDISITGGISGTDAGAEANSTWYALWAIDRTTPRAAVAVTADAGTDLITDNGHGMLANQPVMIGGTAAPAGTVLGQIVYIRDVVANGYKVAATPNGAAINLTSAGIAVTISTVPGLIATTAATPAMPADQSFKARVGAVYNDGGGNFRKMQIFGRRHFSEPVVLLNNVAPAVANTYQSLSLAAAVPSFARTFTGLCGCGSTSDAAAVMMVAGDANGVGMQGHVGFSFSSTLESFYRANPFDVPLMTAQSVVWKGATTGAFHRLVGTGFTIDMVA